MNSNQALSITASSGWQTRASPEAVMLDRPSGLDDRITCLGASPSSPVVLISESSLMSEAVPYFEVTMLEGSSIIVGLTDQVRDNDGGGVPGRRINSLGLLSTGDLSSTVPGNECSLPFSAPFGMLDTVGIGCLKTSQTDVRIFATHNGRNLGTILETKLSICPLFPAVSFEDSGCIITVKKSKPYLFDLPQSMLSSEPSSLTPPIASPSSSSPLQQQASPSAPRDFVMVGSPSARPTVQPHQSWLASQQATFQSSSVGRRLSRLFNPAATRSSRLEADLMEAQEHISVLANVLNEQDQRNQDDLLRELSVSCRRLLVRHANLVREATDDESLNRILALNDRIIELLTSADQVLERRGAAGLAKIVNPTSASSEGSSFGGNLVARGTADTVSEMLFMLRSGQGRSQKNAAQCLARLVKERNHNAMVVINGGVHAFVAMSRPEQQDQELRKLAAKALAELASWVRLPYPIVENGTMTTTRGVFRAVLADVLRTMEVIVDEESLLVAQAISNLILLMTAGKTSSLSSSSPYPVLTELAVPLLLKILYSNLAISAPQPTSPSSSPRSPSSPSAAASGGGNPSTVNSHGGSETVFTSQAHSLVRSNSGHRRALSWTTSSSASTPAASPSGEGGGLESTGQGVKRKVTVDSSEACRVASFGLSLLLRRSDTVRASVVNHPHFFPVMERLLSLSDRSQQSSSFASSSLSPSLSEEQQELLLHGMACMNGLLWSGAENDGFSQGFITARVLQSPKLLHALWHLESNSIQTLKGSMRHHLVASLSALVQHRSVLKALLEVVPLDDVVDSLFGLLNQVLDDCRQSTNESTGPVSSGSSLVVGATGERFDLNTSTQLVDESSLFNLHFRQQQQEVNARDIMTRVTFSQFQLSTALALVPASSPFPSSANHPSVSSLSSKGGYMLPKRSTSSVQQPSMTDFQPQADPLPTLAWELRELSMDLFKVLSADETVTAAANPFAMVVNAIHFDSIVALAQIDETAQDYVSSSSGITKRLGVIDETEFREMVALVRKIAVSTLVLLVDKYTIPDPEAVAAGLLSLCKSNDQEVRVRAVEAIACVSNKSREMATRLFRQDCALKLCGLSETSRSVRPWIASTMTGLMKVVFNPHDTSSVGDETSIEALCDWSLHGFGPNEQVIRFLLQAVEQFEIDPTTATHACEALSIACGYNKPSALGVHYRCAVMKRVFYEVSQMCTRCPSIEGMQAAEDLFKECGFTPGALQIVANDPQAIKEWGSIKVDVEVSQYILDHAARFLVEFAWTDRQSLPAPSSSQQQTTQLTSNEWRFPFYDENIDRAVGGPSRPVTTAASTTIGRMPLKNNSSSSSAPPVLASSNSLPSKEASASPPLVQPLTASSPSMQRFYSDPEVITSTTAMMMLPPSVSHHQQQQQQHQPSPLKNVPQLLLSTVSDLKQNPPSKWLEVMAQNLGQGEAFEKIAREVRESEGSKATMAASILRALATPFTSSASLNSTKPFIDFYSMCLGLHELLQYQSIGPQPFEGVESNLPPLARDLLLKNLHGIGSLQRYVLTSPAGFLIEDEDGTAMDDLIRSFGSTSRTTSTSMYGGFATSSSSSSLTGATGRILLPFVPFRTIRLQSNMNYWAEKLVVRVVGEWSLRNNLGGGSQIIAAGSILSSKLHNSNVRWGLVVPGTAIGDSEEDRNRLTDVLFSCPSIVSLTFSGKVTSPTPASFSNPLTKRGGFGSGAESASLVPAPLSNPVKSPPMQQPLEPVSRLTSVASTASSMSSNGGSGNASLSATTLGESRTNQARLQREQEERLAQFMVTLPSSVAWLSFDRNAVSPEGLRLIAAFLGVRDSGIVGCAVTNSTYSPEEFSDFLRFLSRCESLRFLDLSGNSKLWDTGCATVARSFALRSLTSLDLSGTVLQGGTATVDALLGLEVASTSQSLSRDAKGEARLFSSGLLASGTLRYLSLAKTQLSTENASRLIYALSKRVDNHHPSAPSTVSSRLRVLNLDANNLQMKHLRQALVSFLAFNTTVRELGLAGDDIGPFVVDVARALAGNRSLQVFRYACSVASFTSFSSSSTASASSPATSLTAPASSPLGSSSIGGGGDPKTCIKQIEQSLRANRLEWTETMRQKAHMMPPTPTHHHQSSSYSQERSSSVSTSVASSSSKQFRHHPEEQKRSSSSDNEEMFEGEEEDEDDELVDAEEMRRRTSKLSLHVLFASPLVWRDDSGRLLPLDPLDCDSERQALLTSFDEARSRKGYAVAPVDVNFHFGCTSDTLISVLTRKPTSLHLSTHGEEGYIVMEDGKGGMHAVRIAQVGEILTAANCASFLKLVFVSACNSNHIAETFRRCGAKNVVAVDSRISDKAAQVFTRAFYLSIALGDPVGLAFNLAREAVRSSPLLTESSQQSGNNFILLSSGGDGDDVVFPRIKPTSRTALAMSRPQSLSRFVTDFPDPKMWRMIDAKFVEVLVPGRNVDAYLTIVALSCKRVVTLFGPEGAGKSAIVSGFICKYVNERRIFEDGVVALDLSGCKTASDVQAKLVRLVRETSSSETTMPSPGLSSSTPQSLDANEELEKTIAELSKRRCVLVLDHMDQALEENFDELRFFWGHLLDRTKGVRLLIATRRSQSFSIPGHDDLTHSLPPLSFLDSARLFLKCCPHYHNDLHARPRQGAPPPENFVYGLARHPICAEMGGIAKTVVQTASSISYDQWTDIVEEVTEALIPTLTEGLLEEDPLSRQSSWGSQL